MDIENQIIRIRINNFNQEHFKKLGYTFKLNDYIFIKTKELPDGSGTKVDVMCNYCGKIFKKSWRRYLETKDDVCCDNCKKYKVMKSSLEKYGNVCSLRNESVHNKMIQNNIIKYGCEHYLQNEICKNIFFEKRKLSLKDLNLIKNSTSKQQLHISTLYNGILNPRIGRYFPDILIENNIVCEYDGSGHWLRVKFNEYSEEKFFEYENKRMIYIINRGYKIFRIISYTDILPDDKFLISLKEKALKNLLEYDVYTYNLDDKSENLYKRDELI